MANLVRTGGVLAFYCVEILNYHGSELLGMPQVVSGRLHALVTALVGAWIGMAIITLVSMRLRFFPPLMKYVTTAADLALITAALAVLDGPRSPVLVGVLLIVALSSLRLSQRLIAFSAVGAWSSYLVLSLHAAWLRPALSVPRYHQIIFCLAVLLLAGVLIMLVRAVETIVNHDLDPPTESLTPPAERDAATAQGDAAGETPG